MVLAALALAFAAPRPGELRAAWRSYVAAFVSEDGRVIDRAADDITTSEGQAYGLLRAVWSGDRATFERLRRWTRDNLQYGDPVALPAWKWGLRPDGSWGVLDHNPASDADQLLAYALLLGDAQWRDPALREQAVGMLASIWNIEVGSAGPYTVVLPGPWAKGKDPVRVNPSYFLPFTLREFAEADPGRPWGSLVSDGYDILDATMRAPGLPPDWAFLDATTGRPVPPPPGDEALGRYGMEAFRLVWTLAAEVQWHGEPRARALLERLDVLRRRWSEHGTIPAILEPGGQAVGDWSYLGAYGAYVPAWDLFDASDARRLYRREIRSKRDATGWGRPEDYYAQNWVWFGLALWTGFAKPVPGGS